MQAQLINNPEAGVLIPTREVPERSEWPLEAEARVVDTDLFTIWAGPTVLYGC